jgi:hypothetical protein
MTSHQYAEELRTLAAELDAIEPFPMPTYDTPGRFSYLWDKEGFVAAVRACGSGVKNIKDDSLTFQPRNVSFHLVVERSAVCKLAKPAEWSCEPWLTDEQQVVVDQAAAETSDEGIPF